MTINECEGVVRCLPQSFIWSGIILDGKNLKIFRMTMLEWTFLFS
jgi:hypothetical protein